MVVPADLPIGVATLATAVERRTPLQLQVDREVEPAELQLQVAPAVFLLFQGAPLVTRVAQADPTRLPAPARLMAVAAVAVAGYLLAVPVARVAAAQVVAAALR